MISAIAPNIDSHLFVEVEDENRKTKLTQVILFIAAKTPQGDVVLPVSMNDAGSLQIGGKRLVRKEE